jgi:crossover junction endodeoxyribonuclease RusA
MSDSRTEFFAVVYGTPRPQGSKRHVGNGILIEASKYLPAWRAEIIHACHQVINQTQDVRKFTEPVAATLNFYLPRPDSVDRKFPTVAPDLDKLVRAVFDGLEQAGVLENDSQIVSLDASKAYADEHPEGVSIYLRNVTV